MQVRFSIRGLEQAQAFLKSVPRGTMRAALKAFTEYVIGDDTHGLKHPDPYRYVSRSRAYNPAFKSAKQRAYVMAAIHEGIIKPGSPHRTGRSTSAWQYIMVSDYSYKITNPEAGAYYTRGDPGQANQPRMVGWRKVGQVVSDNIAGAMRSARAAVSAWISASRK